MEAVEEPPLNIPPSETTKVCVISDEAKEITVALAETNVCQKSNGVAESSKSKEGPAVEPKPVIAQDKNMNSCSTMDNIENVAIENPEIEPASSTSENDKTPLETAKSKVEEVDISTTKKPSNTTEEVETEKNVYPDFEQMNELVIEATVDQVTFETEVLVESNDTEVIESICDNTKTEEEETNNILSELGTGIELSEALRSSDVTDNVENNNCSGRQEVFNKEELLDILEGNDDEQCESLISSGYPPISGEKILETQLALQQLSRLKTKSKKPKTIERLPRKKRQKQISIPKVKEEKNIVKVIVKDWDDEESPEVEISNKLVEENEDSSQTSNDALNSVESKQDDVRTSIDSQTTDGTPGLNKSGDETQPQRRLGRVIKKKVIFDPDNPDTFTKSKVISKGKDHVQEKDQTQIKKIKTEPPTFQRSKSKSPISKLQWKKPSPKNNKQNKRLTEVDKLLMDEGAVNMIYQLTPEAPKGKKNMKTKAEFIKKIQSSSTPDTKEMKFRERKKESKYEDSEARRILGGKQRPSLSSSVKSHCVSEDFEAHSADDSIIYRRHSSSSYSSSCMSPRRLSDVETTGQISRKAQNLVNNEVKNENQAVEMFMPDTEEVTMEIINKDNCLSIKEKLNSKLNLALKKRKRDSSKSDKPPKQKKIIKPEEHVVDDEEFKYLSIEVDGKLALICVQKSESISNVEMITELEKAFKVINNIKDVSVTLLLPECGSTYSDLDIKTLLDDNSEKRTTYAYKMAESIRTLLLTVEQHSKLLCTGASGRCSGVLLALIGLSDVALASERASFAVSMKSQSVGLIEPGISVLTSYRHLPESSLNDMIVFGRRMSAADALQNGLVSRVLWPEKFNEQVLRIVKDIAAQPAQNIWLKKQILSLKKSGSESTFQKCLEKERDLFVAYWTSDEGQELLRATYNGA